MASRRVSQSQFSLLLLQLKKKGYRVSSKDRTSLYVEYILISPNGMTRRLRYTNNGWMTYE